MNDRLVQIYVDQSFRKKMRIAAAEHNKTIADLSRDIASENNEFLEKLHEKISKKKSGGNNSYGFNY